MRVIREIVEAEPKGKGTCIAEALAFLSRVQKRRAVCFLLSDFLDDDFESPLKVALARHDLVAMRVTDPAELSLPDLGLVELVDAETGAPTWVDTFSPAVRKTYAARRERAQRDAERRLRQLGCDMVDLTTGQDFVAPLVKFFQLRSARLRAGR